MSGYTRQPKKALAKCPVAGCNWQRIYWQADRRHAAPETRAKIAVSTHLRHEHPGVPYMSRQRAQEILCDLVEDVLNGKIGDVMRLQPAWCQKAEIALERLK